MDFEAFADRVKNDLANSYPDLDFNIRQVEKLRGESYSGISITPKKGNVGASINLERAFEEYQKGVPMIRVIDRLMTAVDKAKEKMPDYDVEQFLNYSQMKDKLIMQVVPTESNAEMLASIPHKEIEDLSVVYRFAMESTEDGMATILINNELLERYGITAEQLMQDAEAIAPEHNPATLRNMSDVMSEMSDGLLNMPPSPMWVASVESGVNGAGIIGYPDFMDQAAEKLGGDFYLLPSSVHEVILIADDGSMNAQELSGKKK